MFCSDSTPAFRWPAHLQHALDDALAYAEGHDQSTIENAIEAKMLQLWEAPNSFCLTELKVSPNGIRTVHLFLAGGNLEELEPLYPIIEQWAKTQGARGMTMLGRFGWERTFFVRTQGFRPVAQFYAKELV